MKRVAIMAPVGIHEPRWSPRPAAAADEDGTGAGSTPADPVAMLIRGPQAARDFQEPRLERGLDLLQPVDGDAALDEDGG